MAERKRLEVSDLFKSIGRWNDLYGRVIALNTLVFSSGQLHYSFKKTLTWDREDFEFYSCDGSYTNKMDRNGTAFFLEKKYGESKASFSKYEFSLFADSGELVGILVLIALYRLSTSVQLAIGVFLYIMCPAVHLTNSKTFARASLFLSGISVRMLRIPTMMHCMESLPQHLRIYGLSIMFGASLVSNLSLILFIKTVSYSLLWTHTMIAAVILLSCFLHIWLAPPSILNTLFNADTVTLQNELVKWVPEEHLIDIDDLVDYVLYRGPVYSSQMNSFSQLIAMGPFFRKAVICAILLPLDSFVIVAARTYQSNRFSVGEQESEFFYAVLFLIGAMLTIVLNSVCGRRCTLSIAMASLIFCQLLMMSLTLEKYNACRALNTLQGWRGVLAEVAYVCAIVTSSFFKVTMRLVLLEHVPTSLRSVVPLAFFYSTVTIMLYSGIQALTTQFLDSYPNSFFIYSLTYTLFTAPFVFLIDDSTYMAMNSAEIAAYTVPSRPFPMNLDPSDGASEHFSTRMVLEACAAAEAAKQQAKTEFD
ncbi:hypothetical protein Q1695_003613 [Nippostrongylus brasiliensis]|nr:hypothetical protein Q1695_003613 [Nippostrongylus brasiliensis]